MTKKTKILALDGGTHGFTWLFCLREIEADNPGFLYETDVFTGSSFGGFCSLYLARHMGGLKRGDSALSIIEGCIAFMKQLLNFNPDQAAFGRLLGGVESMYSHDRMQAVLTDPAHLGDARLGDMHRRVIITTSGTSNPSWSPKIYDSDDEADKKVPAFEIGLASAALPVMLPLRNGLTNGSLGGSNSSMHGLTRVVGGDSKISMNDVALLSLGGDPGTSTLVNNRTPWEGGDAVPPPLSLGSILTPKPEDAEAFALLQQKVQDLWQLLDQSVTKQHSDPEYARKRIGVPLHAPAQVPAPTTHGSTSWGWRHWLLYQSSPLFFYAAIVNNQALDIAEQTHLLLGERTVRIAPMALLSSGQILFMTFLSAPPANQAIVGIAELTAELWADPETNQKFEFKPSVQQAEAFIDRFWMPDRRVARTAPKARRSGWRRGRPVRV